MPLFTNSKKFPYLITQALTKNQKLVWLLSIALPVAGFALEYHWGNIFFARSGALLVCVALVCFYSNVIVGEEIENGEKSLPLLQNLGGTYEQIRARLATQVGESTAEIAAMDVLAFQENAKSELPRLNETSNRLTTAEFVMALLGTIIWGFGDLISPIIFGLTR